MNVLVFLESFNHVRVIAQVSHDAQLNLWIVGREEFASFVGDESLSDFLSVFVADRNVLQVRVAWTQSSGSCDRLVERRMDASGSWIDKLGEGINVGT